MNLTPEDRHALGFTRKRNPERAARQNHADNERDAMTMRFAMIVRARNSADRWPRIRNWVLGIR